MSDLRECPCCFGILDVPLSYKLTSACRCGFPGKVTWDNFPAPREAVKPPYTRMSIKTLDDGREQVAA